MIDQWIDRALSTYAAAEPMAGLEERVLNRIRIADSERRRRSRIMNWALAIPILASLIISAVVLRTTPQKLELPPPKIALASLLAPPGSNVSSKPRRQMSIPLPAPITGDERALLALATSQPAAAVQAFGDLQKKSNEPLEIEEIKILPLQSDGNE